MTFGTTQYGFTMCSGITISLANTLASRSEGERDLSNGLQMRSHGYLLRSELPQPDQERIAKFLNYRASIDGDIGPSHDSDIKGDVVEIKGDRIVFETRWPGTYTRKQLELTLGGRAIKESIAYLVERHTAGLIAADEPFPPAFPYEVLSRLSAFLTKSELHPMAIAALGTIALLTNDPTGTFCAATIAYFTRISDKDRLDLGCLDELAAEFASAELRETLDVVSREDLPSIKSIHVGRGASERAVAFIVDETERALRRRLADPLFDIRHLIELRPEKDPIASLIQMMKDEFLPCDMEFQGAVRTFLPPEKDELGFELSQYLRSFQSQQEFMMMHVGTDGQRFLPSNQVQSSCAFLTCCDHPNRVLHPEDCVGAPWKQYAAPIRCWYANGVAATIGPHTLKKIST